ncbi:hypothetical protein [Bradyrhizobium sp.]|uniref:hypothetical protein n=1 Tax=Bradyrhizobium sp. TaxID=376 RepID=UPI0025BF5615|nr:hypothetical protein [Bradyrhizobium sp.]
MPEIDAFFRPAAAALALLTAFLLLRDARFDFRARLGVLFGIGTAAYMFCSGAPGVWGATSLLVPLCIGNSVFFWWFALALLEDDFRLETLHVGVLLVVLTLGFARIGAHINELAAPGQALAVIHNLIILTLVAHVLLLAWRGYDNDLLENRRRFRLLFLIGGSLVTVELRSLRSPLPGDPQVPGCWRYNPGLSRSLRHRRQHGCSAHRQRAWHSKTRRLPNRPNLLRSRIARGWSMRPWARPWSMPLQSTACTSSKA